MGPQGLGNGDKLQLRDDGMRIAKISNDEPCLLLCHLAYFVPLGIFALGGEENVRDQIGIYKGPVFTW